jgi:hypothetical protein
MNSVAIFINFFICLSEFICNFIYLWHDSQHLKRLSNPKALHLNTYKNITDFNKIMERERILIQINLWKEISRCHLRSYKTFFWSSFLQEVPEGCSWSFPAPVGGSEAIRSAQVFFRVPNDSKLLFSILQHRVLRFSVGRFQTSMASWPFGFAYDLQD